jgi:hypothetical protein
VGSDCWAGADATANRERAMRGRKGRMSAGYHRRRGF